MTSDSQLALFILLGQSASQELESMPEVPSGRELYISGTFDLATSLPEEVGRASTAALGYKLFFVFENYLRDFVVNVLSEDGKADWWQNIPTDVQDEVQKIEQNEEVKGWMALGSRDKSALMTYPQLLRVVDHCWKSHFKEIVRDKALVQEGRMISHLRNTLCHMSEISDEEMDRVKQVIRDWFRIVSP